MNDVSHAVQGYLAHREKGREGERGRERARGRAWEGKRGSVETTLLLGPP